VCVLDARARQCIRKHVYDLRRSSAVLLSSPASAQFPADWSNSEYEPRPLLAPSPLQHHLWVWFKEGYFLGHRYPSFGVWRWRQVF